MEAKNKVSVVLSSEEFGRFHAFCVEKGYKKSTLAARLIREHLDREGYRVQGTLPLLEAEQKPPSRKRHRGPGARRPP